MRLATFYLCLFLFCLACESNTSNKQTIINEGEALRNVLIEYTENKRSSGFPEILEIMLKDTMSTQSLIQILKEETQKKKGSKDRSKLYWKFLDEPFLDTCFTEDREIYRLSIEGTVTHNLKIIRIEKMKDDIFLVYKNYDRVGNLCSITPKKDCYKLIEKKEKELTLAEWEAFKAEIRVHEFWNTIYTRGGSSILDGTDYCLEGARNCEKPSYIDRGYYKSHHFLYRNTPDEYTALYQLSTYLEALCK